MAARLYLRTGEVPALYGLDASKSEWALWNALTEGEDQGAGDYGKWQSRLMVPIMTGIAEDHRIKVQEPIDPHSTKCTAIMPPKSWRVAPSVASGGREAVLVVTQRAESTLREWKEPGTMPPKTLMRFKAVAAAHDISDVLIGVLVDGYSSRVFHVHVPDEERAEIRRRSEEFVAKVAAGEEPDIDFGMDERAIRAGKTIAKVEMAAEAVGALIDERAKLIAERAPVDASIKRIEVRMRQIDTNLIHVAGPDGRIEVGQRMVIIERDGKGTPRVTVVDRAPSALF